MDRLIDRWIDKLINRGIDLVYLPWVFIFLSGDSIYNPGGSVCLTTLETKFSLNPQMLIKIIQKKLQLERIKIQFELNNCLKKIQSFSSFLLEIYENMSELSM